MPRVEQQTPLRSTFSRVHFVDSPSVLINCDGYLESCSWDYEQCDVSTMSRLGARVRFMDPESSPVLITCKGFHGGTNNHVSTTISCSVMVMKSSSLCLFRFIPGGLFPWRNRPLWLLTVKGCMDPPWRRYQQPYLAQSCN